MAAPTNWKLGLFVVVGIVLSLTTMTFLGAESLKKKVVSYQTYFDESVQGLEVPGSPVKFRASPWRARVRDRGLLHRTNATSPSPASSPSRT